MIPFIITKVSSSVIFFSVNFPVVCVNAMGRVWVSEDSSEGWFLGHCGPCGLQGVGLSGRFVLQAFLPSEPRHGTYTPPTIFIVLKLGLILYLKMV